MGLSLAILIVLGIGAVYAALLKLLQAPSSLFWKALRHSAINRTVRRELVDFDRQYAQIFGS